MTFRNTDVRRELGDSLQRLLAREYDFQARSAAIAAEPGYPPALWRRLVDLGLPALPLPSAYGGFDGDACDLAAVVEEFGRALLVAPWLSSAVLGAGALRLAAGAAMRAALLPRVASGELLLAFAHAEAAARHPMWVASTARPGASGWQLTGRKCNVLHGADAHFLVVSARVAGEPGSDEGVALFLLEGRGPGATVRRHLLVDDTPAAELLLQDAQAVRLEAGDAAVVRQVLAQGMAASCAEAVGCMQAAYEMTLEYLKVRRQFGRPLGHNQALRHRAAEMLVRLETCRSMAAVAAEAASAWPAGDAWLEIARARALVSRHGRALCLDAIQMHGGIGMSEECMVGHFLRRVTVLDALFGDEHSLLAELAARLEPPDPFP